MPAYRRYETLQGIEYEVQGSHGNWYTVPMIDGHATGCECIGSKHRPTCKHQTTAEQAEKAYQSQLNNAVETPAEKRQTAPLHHADGFSLQGKR